MKLTVDQKKAIDAIYISMESLRGSLEMHKMLDLILFMLMWAKFAPQTNKSTIGFFDVLETLESIYQLEYIVGKLSQETGLEMNFIYDSVKFFGPEGSLFSLSSNFENLRGSLLPAAKLVAKGNKEDIDQIVGFFKEITYDSLGKSSFELNKEILEFSKKIFNDVDPDGNEINCLYPLGTSSAYYFARTRNTFIYENNKTLEEFNKGLISLYGKPFKFEDYEDRKNISFVAPPILKNNSLNIQEYIPFEEDEESNLINDLHCKMIYLAHENTLNTSIAITTSGTLFSKSNGINFFRKRIIEKNWLDAIILLPQIFAGSGISGVMLILKKDRSQKDKIQFIDFSDCEKDRNVKRGKLVIPSKEIETLFKTYKKKKKSNISSLVSIDEIKSNDYNLNHKRYILSDEDIEIINLMEEREVFPLSTLVDIKRPFNVPSFTSKSGWEELNVVLLNDINYIGEITTASKKIKVKKALFNKFEGHWPYLEKDDIVISIKGTLGKVGIVKRDMDRTLPGPSLCVLRPNYTLKKTMLDPESPLNPENLFQFLRSAIGQKLIRKSSQGEDNSFISIDELKNLSIIFPTLEEKENANKITKRSQELLKSIEKMRLELDEGIYNGWLQIEKKDKEEKE